MINSPALHTSRPKSGGVALDVVGDSLLRFERSIQNAKDQTSKRYVPVTRTEPLTFEQNQSNLDLSNPIGFDVFCDWLTCYQDHFGIDLPIINDGYVVRFEPHALREWIDPKTGQIEKQLFDATKAEYTVSRKMEHEGSFETKISIRCDGRRVELSGNVGRFGRTDNLYGLPVVDAR